MTEHVTRNDDGLLHSRVRGTGETVVLVHGSASDRRTWRHQEGPFCDRFHTVSYSRRHHWPNPAIGPGIDYVADEHVADLRHLVQRHAEHGAHLVGHSYGGVVCLLLAARYPQLVRGLVLIEPAVVSLLVSDPPRPGQLVRLLARDPGSAWAVLKLGAIGIEPARRAARRGDMELALRRFGRAVLGAPTFAQLSHERWEQALANNIRAEYLGSGLPPLSQQEVRQVAASTLLVTGEQSPEVFSHLARHLAELLPDVRLAAVPGASHLVHEDQPARFNRLVLDFLATRAG